MLLAMYNNIIMKNIFGENFFRSIFVFLTLAFIFCLTSCFNLFSKSDDEEQQITVIGRINLDSNLSFDFLISPEAAENRSATPDPLTIDGTTYEYYIKATRTKNEDGSNDGSTTRETNTVASTDKTFTLDLLPGTWKIEVSVQKVSDSATILYCKQTGIELSADDPIFNLDFYLTPVISDEEETPSYYEGTINLKMSVPSTVSYAKIETRNFPAYASDFSDVDHLTRDAVTGYITFSKNNVKCGTYDLLFTFYKSDGTPLFSTSQTINVLRNLETKHWVGTTSALIKADGTFELTDQLIKAWRERRVEYYVGGTGALDTNTGGPLDPLATVKHAIALVNDIAYGDTTVKIHMADGTLENVSETIVINNGKKVEIDVLDGGTATLGRAAGFTASTNTGAYIFKVGPYSGANTQLTIKNIILDGNFRKDPSTPVYNAYSEYPDNFNEDRRTPDSSENYNCLIYNYGTLINESGILQNNSDVAVYNAKNATFYMNGGAIQKNITFWSLGSHASPPSNDMQTRNGAAVFTQGTFIMNGGKIINNLGRWGTAIYQANYGSVTLNGGEISGNCAHLQLVGSASTIISTDSSITIGGPVKIYGNFLGDHQLDFPTKTPCNLTLSSSQTLAINGSLVDGTEKANIYLTTRAKPTVSIGESVPTLVSVTSGYNSSVNKEVHPGTYFHSDEGYAVVAGKNMSGYYYDAELALSGGGLSGKYYENIEFTFTGPDTIWAGSSAKQTVTVKKNGTEIEEPSLTLEFLNSYGSDFSLSTYRTFSENELTLLDSLPEGKYTTGVSLVDNGIKYTGTKTFTVAEKEKSIVSGSFDTTMTSNLSDVFKKGRTSVANIRPLIASSHEVTQKEWKAIMHVSQEDMNSNDFGIGDNYPVYYVNWYMAIAYCNKLSLAEGKTPCYAVSGITDWNSLAYSNIPTSDNATWNAVTCNFDADGWRLPTEAEWEYLARGGNLTTTGQTTYSGSSTCGDVAWYSENSGNKTHEVCTKAPNELGLYDMSGNIWELCWDLYNDNISTTTPETGASSGSFRIRRGGCFNNETGDCSVSTRNYCYPYNGNSGFRVVRNAE